MGFWGGVAGSGLWYSWVFGVFRFNFVFCWGVYTVFITSDDLGFCCVVHGGVLEVFFCCVLYGAWGFTGACWWCGFCILVVF